MTCSSASHKPGDCQVLQQKVTANHSVLPPGSKLVSSQRSKMNGCPFCYSCLQGDDIHLFTYPLRDDTLSKNRWSVLVARAGTCAFPWDGSGVSLANAVVASGKSGSQKENQGTIIRKRGLG